MEIVLKRWHRDAKSVDGRLSINEEKVCYTAESPQNLLPEGSYPILLHTCKQYGRQCLCIGNRPNCEACRQLDFVECNTLMPSVCPMLKPGNGVCGRGDGSILVGEHVNGLWGLLLHSRPIYDKLHERIRKANKRGVASTLRVE